jgi:rhomboid family GlyGly-CTERM serine protease
VSRPTLTVWPGRRRRIRLPPAPVFALGLAALYLLLGPAPSALLWDRAAIAHGQIWRLFTGHLVHVDPNHLLLNLAGFLLLDDFLSRAPGVTPRRRAGLWLFSMGFVALGLYALDPALSLYAGLSGCLNAPFAALCLLLWRGNRTPWPLALLLVGFAKPGLEAVGGLTLYSHISWPPVPLAHYLGLLAGIAWWAASEATAGKTCAGFRHRLVSTPAQALSRRRS